MDGDNGSHPNASTLHTDSAGDVDVVNAQILSAVVLL